MGEPIGKNYKRAMMIGVLLMCGGMATCAGSREHSDLAGFAMLLVCSGCFLMMGAMVMARWKRG